MSKITDYSIMKEYFDKSSEFDTLQRNYKMAGNIFAFVIMNNIKEILKGTGYKVSTNNSFIDGIRNEWDLLIVKENSSDNKVNIYNKEAIKCIIELKTASFFRGDWSKYKGTDDEKMYIDITNRFSTIKDVLIDSNIKCRYLYISLFQNSNHKADISLENVINDINETINGKKYSSSVFFFRVDTKYSEPKKDYDEERKKKEIEKFSNGNFENFILDSIK